MIDKNTIKGSFIFRGKEYNSNTILTNANLVANYLFNNIESRSPFIYLFATNHIKTIFFYCGIIKANRICILIDPNIGTMELSGLEKETAPAAWIKPSSYNDQLDFQHEIILNHKSGFSINEDLSNVVTAIYTAAENGHPQAAMLTIDNLLSNAQSISIGNKVTENSITCAILPFNHSFGFQVGVITPMISGGKSLIIEKLLDVPHTLLKNPGNTAITHWYSTPAIYYLLSKNKNNHLFDDSYSLISGGYKLPSMIYQKFLKTHNRKIKEGYGLTEASPVCTWNYPDDDYSENSIGKPISCCKVKIFGADRLEVQLGQTGEIAISGSNIMKGYYNKPIENKKTIFNGWLFTGDFGHIDERGYIYYDGLKKKMINYGGKKVYPSEVERLLLLNKNVQCALVYGINNPIFSETVGARIKLYENNKNTQSIFRTWCKVNLTNYKIPSTIIYE